MSERQNHPPLRPQPFSQDADRHVLVARGQVMQDSHDQNGVERDAIWQSA